MKCSLSSCLAWLAVTLSTYSFPCVEAFVVQGPALGKSLPGTLRWAAAENDAEKSASLICPLLDPPTQPEATFEAAMG